MKSIAIKQVAMKKKVGGGRAKRIGGGRKARARPDGHSAVERSHKIVSAMGFS
jgi:hypothetical protein